MVKRATVKRAGVESGSIIFLKILNSEAPSILADSINSSGMEIKNCRKRKMLKAPPPQKAGTIRGR